MVGPQRVDGDAAAGSAGAALRVAGSRPGRGRGMRPRGEGVIAKPRASRREAAGTRCIMPKRAAAPEKKRPRGLFAPPGPERSGDGSRSRTRSARRRRKMLGAMISSIRPMPGSAPPVASTNAAVLALRTRERTVPLLNDVEPLGGQRQLGAAADLDRLGQPQVERSRACRSALVSISLVASGLLVPSPPGGQPERDRVGAALAREDRSPRRRGPTDPARVRWRRPAT